MSEAIFNFNLERIRKVRSLKGQKLSVVINSRLPHVDGRPLFLTKDGSFSTDLLMADFNATTSVSTYVVYALYDSDIEDYAKRIMTENEKYMDHMSYHPSDWEHVE